MTISTTAVSDILKRSSVAARNTGNTRQLTTKLNSTLTKVQTGEKYANIAEAEYDGVGKKLSSIRSTLITNTNYLTAIAITQPKLQTQTNAVTAIKVVLDEFNGSIDAPGPLTKTQAADRALTKLAEILQRRDGGEYIFGGENNNENPLTTDIVSNNNVVDNQLTSNYTNTTEDMSTVGITDEISVRANRLYAGLPGIQEMIGMLHGYKNETDSVASTSSKVNDINTSLSVLTVSLSIDIIAIKGSNTTPSATDILNDQRVAADIELSNINGVNVPEETSAASALLLSIVTNLSIAQTRNSLLSQFSQILMS